MRADVRKDVTVDVIKVLKEYDLASKKVCIRVIRYYNAKRNKLYTILEKRDIYKSKIGHIVAGRIRGWNLDDFDFLLENKDEIRKHLTKGWSIPADADIPMEKKTWRPLEPEDPF